MHGQDAFRLGCGRQPVVAPLSLIARIDGASDPHADRGARDAKLVATDAPPTVVQPTLSSPFMKSLT